MNEMSMQGTLSAAERSIRSVFVGNIPYEATEEQLKDIFSEVGPVVSFRLVYDRETGKPKGYGFCEYKDQDTALSAMRNLNGHDLNGRALRVDNAASEKNKEELKNLQASLGGPPVESPYGPECSPEKAPEAISKAVASLPPEQMFELMKQMKLCIQNNLIEARNMLLQNPQLAYALLQAQVVMRIVEPHVAMGMLHRPNTAVEPIMPAGGPSIPPSQTSHQTNMPSSIGNHQGGPPQSQQPPPPNNFNDMHFSGGNMSMNQMGGGGGPRGPVPGAMPRHVLLDRPGSEPQRAGMGGNQMADPRGPAGGRDYDMRDARGNLIDRDPRAGGMPMGGQHMMGGGGGGGGRDPREQPHMRGDPRGDGRPVPHDADSRGFDPRARGGGVADPRTQRGPVDFDPRGGGPQGGFEQRGGPAPFPDRANFDQRSPVYDQRDPRNQGPAGGRAQAGPPMGRAGGPMGGAPIASQDQEKAALIMQVLQLSDQQIAMLPPEQRQSIMVLKEQIARTAQNQ